MIEAAVRAKRAGVAAVLSHRCAQGSGIDVLVGMQTGKRRTADLLDVGIAVAAHPRFQIVQNVRNDLIAVELNDGRKLNAGCAEHEKFQRVFAEEMPPVLQISSGEY